MIAMPRSLALRFRAVLRRCADRRDNPFVLARASRKGLTLEAVLPEVAIRVELPGQQEDSVLAFPAAALMQFEGRGDDPVSLEEVKPGKGRATWPQAGTTSSKAFPTVKLDGRPPFPKVPADMKPAGDGFLRAMHDAAQTAADSPTRLTLDRIMLRGRTGEVIATDGRQLLIQRGFRLPWKEDRLIPGCDVWGCRELPQEEPLVGCTDKQVFVRVGPWTFAL